MFHHFSSNEKQFLNIPDNNFFQRFISCLDKSMTSSCVVAFLTLFTVIPIRVFWNTAKKPINIHAIQREAF